ncbi:MAG: 8-hydroxy-5-deazaflavin:NADPH oxidoreductase [Frankiales bacterium]|jgi:predicted dinucleotide-binding enzyme|nr:8-hydroxy-5-deazaflavin:NADPH oxidoreductase [Frankiales bacterium]
MGTIGVIGVGRVGSTLARHFARLGHEVAVSNSRGPETLKGLQHELGDHAHALSVAEAAEYGDIAVVSIPLVAYRDVPRAGLEGKVVIDTCNYYPQRDGHFPELDDDSMASSELIAAHLPTSHVVKAFNAITSVHLAEWARPTGDPARIAIPIAGNNAAAKRTVANLIDQMGFDAVDTGDLGSSRSFQPGAVLYGADASAEKVRATLGLTG